VVVAWGPDCIRDLSNCFTTVVGESKVRQPPENARGHNDKGELGAVICKPHSLKSYIYGLMQGVKLGQVGG
jgi:hypothetical protein